MKWLLILIVIWPGASPAITQIDFSSEAACHAAQSIITQGFERVQQAAEGRASLKRQRPDMVPLSAKVERAHVYCVRR
ncbi:MAG TPA: hypothetical protein VKB51_12285 [bacterium]|nr:hypothetical protein [bacterium]